MNDPTDNMRDYRDPMTMGMPARRIFKYTPPTITVVQGPPSAVRCVPPSTSTIAKLIGESDSDLKQRLLAMLLAP